MNKFIVSLMALGITSMLWADVKPAGVFQDKMVLQREKPIAVWGSADPGETVTVTFKGQSKSVTADHSGKWMVKLNPVKADAKNDVLKISGKNNIELKDILVGDVWLASGQSNMGFTMPETLNAEAELKAADYPAIRFLPVQCRWNNKPTDEFTGNWMIATPENARVFSAIAFFFARDLHKKLNVPIGIIQSAWGGTPVESWIPIEDMKAGGKAYEKFMGNYYKFENISNEKLAEMRSEAEKTQRQKDPGNQGEKLGYAKNDFDASGWKDINVPGYLEQVYGDNADGVFWFRREVDIPPEMAEKDLMLNLGPVDDLDTTYFNGEVIGSTGFEVPDWWDYPRNYKIPARLIKPGKNLLAVRVVDERYAGGIPGMPPGNKLSIDDESGKVVVDLAGKWKIKDEVIMKPLPGPDFAYIPHIPSYLWNGMINPFVPFTLRGFIWHQGENNSGDPISYRKLFPDMIKAWRREFKQGDLPFYFVQLSNYMKRGSEPTQEAGGWPGLREAQAMTESLPNTGMAVTIDIGDANDIHPKNKQGNGDRLARIALGKEYGDKNVVYMSPKLEKMTIQGDKVLLTFNLGTAGQGGLKVRGEKLVGFSICGADRKFVWAEAKIVSDNEVLVWAEEIKNPVAVRYAWANNPECNLFGRDNLPAGPFRTDDWD